MVKKKNPELFREELTTEELLGVIRDAAKIGVSLVDIDGGEPLLRKDIFILIKEIRKLGMTPLLVTNGTLMTEKMAKKLIDSGLSSIIVSLDGSNSEIHDKLRGVRGCFEKSIEAIKILRKVGKDKLTVGINTLITQENHRDLLNIAKLTKKLGINYIRFLPYHIIYPHNIYSSQNETLFISNEEEILELEQEIQKLIKFTRESRMTTNSKIFLKKIPDYFRRKIVVKNCYAGYLFVDINCYGDVYPCLLKRTKLNIKNSSFESIWGSKPFHELRKKIRKGKCKNCWHSCYMEPNIRTSLFYILGNFRDICHEINLYMNKN